MLRDTRNSMHDLVYGCRMSADETLLPQRARHPRRNNYPEMTVRLAAPMPDLQEYDATSSPWADPRPGFITAT